MPLEIDDLLSRLLSRRPITAIGPSQMPQLHHAIGCCLHVLLHRVDWGIRKHIKNGVEFVRKFVVYIRINNILA